MDDATQSAFRLLLLDLLAMADGSVRPADSTQPTEGDEYAIVQFSESDYQGFGGSVVDADDIDAGIRAQLVQITVTVDFFGHRAGTLASLLPVVLTHDAAIQRLDDLGLSFVDASPARNLSALELDRIQRFQVRLELQAVQQHQSPTATGQIQSATVGFIAEP